MMDNKTQSLFSNVITQNELFLLWLDNHNIMRRINSYRIKRKRKKFIQLFENCIDNLIIDKDFMIEFSDFFNKISPLTKLYSNIEKRILKCSIMENEDNKIIAVYLSLTIEHRENVQLTFFDNVIEINHKWDTIKSHDDGVYFRTSSCDYSRFANSVYELYVKNAIKKVVKYYIYGQERIKGEIYGQRII